MVPILGSYTALTKCKNAATDSEKSHAIVLLVKEKYYRSALERGEKVPAITGVDLGSRIGLVIGRPEVAEEIFLTKNKYFDKYHKFGEFFGRLLGDSILIAPSDLKWQQKRKALSAALYKEKLKAMIETMKGVTIDTIKDKWMNAKES
jgi:cytochrome P450